MARLMQDHRHFKIATTDATDEKLSQNDSHEVETSLLNRPSRKRKLGGWIKGRSWHVLVRSGVLAAIIVLAINVAALAVAYSRFDVHDNVTYFWTGDCDRAGNIVTGAHLIINVLGSLLLAASNTGMQCLSSPSRAEVDTAHKQKKSFAIGVRSFRNVLQVSRIKTCLWLLLAVSSLPLHLIWNSVVFQTLAANNYYAMSVTSGFAEGKTWMPFSIGTQSAELDGMNETIARMQTLAGSSDLEMLSRSQCLRAYGRELVTGRRHVLMVTDSDGFIDTTPFGSPSDEETGFNSSLLALYAGAITGNATLASPQDAPSYSWMCIPPQTGNERYGYCDLVDIEHLASNEEDPWIPGYYDQAFEHIYTCGSFGGTADSYRLIGCGIQGNAQVKHCLSERVTNSCKVGLIPTFLIVVCVCTAIKLIALVCAIRFTINQGLLVTQGDAVESFLTKPDPLLRGICLATRRDFQRARDTEMALGWREDSRLKDGEPEPLRFESSDDPTRPRRKVRSMEHIRWRWWFAADGMRWSLASALVLGFLIVAAIAFTKYRGTDWAGTNPGMEDKWDILTSQGLGQPQPNFLLSSGKTPILHAFILANLPQFLWSCLYVEINNLLTSTLGMAEWTSFYAAPTAQGLRVSNPTSGSSQRASPFLTLPFRWGLPTLIVFMVLHWLTSEMLFAAKIDTYSFQGGIDPATSLTAIYYSLMIAICLTTIGFAALVVLVLLVNCKHFPKGAPLAGNCSASIAAACQPFPGEESFEPGLALRKLRWGVVKVPHDETDVGHATFSDRPVGVLLPDRRYT